MLRLDHLAVGCRDLGQGVAWVEAAFGLPMSPGGAHARYATHNRLFSLGPGLYLEVIAPDPGAAVEGPRWFALDRFEGAPRLVNWICATDALDAAMAAAPVDAGQPVAMARGDLRWRIGVPPDGSLPADGGWPTLIEWGQGPAHPATRLPDHGVRLLRLTVVHPDAGALGPAMGRQLDDTRVAYETGSAPALRALFATPSGERELA